MLAFWGSDSFRFEMYTFIMAACINRNRTILSKSKRWMKQVPFQPTAMYEWNSKIKKPQCTFKVWRWVPLRYISLHESPSYPTLILNLSAAVTPTLFCFNSFPAHHGRGSTFCCFPFLFLQDSQRVTMNQGIQLNFSFPITASQWPNSS